MTRRQLLVIGLVAVTPQLQSCVPVVAAGAGAAVLVAEDRRTTGIYLEDQNIELKAGNLLRDKFGKDDRVHINVTSFNRYVLLSGEVPDEDTKKEAGVLALGIENVRNVQNELAVGAVTSLSQRASDGYMTSKVKAQFVSEAKFQANYVKVVTDNDVVFLMGLVTRKEADDATEIARTTGGVSKVVRVFELTD
jgi:osmotically-inducible protein OsmY